MAGAYRKTKRAAAGTPASSSSAGKHVVYDGLKPGQRTWLRVDSRHPLGPVKRTAEGKAALKALGRLGVGMVHVNNAQPHLFPGDTIELGDLEDGSNRSRIIKGHLDRGICRIID